MGDMVKIAAKVALITVVMASAVIILTAIELPRVDLTVLGQIIGHAKAIIAYYTESTALFQILWNLGVGLLTFRYIVFPAVRLGAIATRWIMKVNE